MMETLKIAVAMLIGLGTGLVVSGAVFAFITIIGVVPRFAQKTRTDRYVKIYESAIISGGIFGTLTGVVQLSLPIGAIAVAFISVSNGIFFGALAMSLAEVLNVIPIMTRRTRIQHGMTYFVLAIALGKFVGALIYFLVSGFYDAGSM